MTEKPSKVCGVRGAGCGAGQKWVAPRQPRWLLASLGVFLWGKKTSIETPRQPRWIKAPRGVDFSHVPSGRVAAYPTPQRSVPRTAPQCLEGLFQ